MKTKITQIIAAILPAVLLVLNAIPLAAQSPNFSWSNRAGGPSYDFGYGIAVDNNGNTYVSGSFTGSATFGGTTLSTSNSNEIDLFVAKYNEVGTVQWVVQGGGSNITGQGIAVDSNGNCYVVGSFKNIVTFGSTTLISSGLNDLFLVKYNANGEPQWAVRGGGTNEDGGIGIAIDDTEHIYITGGYTGTAIFGNITLSSGGNSDPMVIKYNSSGDVIWATNGGGSGAAGGQYIALDNHGNSYIHGFFNGILTFDSITLSAHHFYTDVFTTKFDSNGNVLWSNQAGGSSSDEGRGIAVDSSGNCYVTGSFSGTATFSNTVLPNNGFAAYIAKYNSSGDLQWVKKNDGTGPASGFRIELDQSGNIYVCGSFSQSISFGTTILNSNGLGDIFLAKFDVTGIPIWAVSGGGAGNEICYGLAVHPIGDCFLTGQFNNSAAFGSTMLISSGQTDIFIANVSERITALEPGFEPFALPVIPNPFTTSFSMPQTNTESAEAVLLDMLGREVYRQKVIADAGSKTLEITPAATLLPGMYLLRLQQGLEVRHSRIIKQ